MESKRIARQQRASHGVSAALSLHLPIVHDKNFLKENYKSLRSKEKQIQEEKIKKAELENQPQKANPKYSHVKSKVFDILAPVTRSSSARSASRPNSKGTQSLHAEFGRVPEYLQLERKVKEEKERVEKERKSGNQIVIPPGHRLLPEQERQETIEMLQRRKKEVEACIGKLPLRIEIDSQRRRQSDLEKRLKDIETALQFLHKPNVVVKIDS
jgi:Calmodulin-binding